MLALDPTFSLTLRAALAVLLLWVAAHKLRDLIAFRAALEAYALLPPSSIATAAAVIIATELGIAVSLLLPSLRGTAAVAAAALFGTYAYAIAINLQRGRRHIDCGCAGAASRRPISASLVVRNALLVAVAIASAVPSNARQLHAIDAMTIGFGVIMLSLLYAAVDGLISNAPRLAALANAHGAHDLIEGHQHQPDHA